MEEENIIIGEKFEREITQSLGELLFSLLRIHDDKILQRCAVTGENLPARVLLNKAIHVAKWFRRNNLGPGDSISISSENHLDFCIAPVAGFLVGITFAPLNPEYTEGELKHVLNLSKPKVMFCSPNTINTILSILPNHPYLKHVILFGKDRVNHRQVTMYSDIIQGAFSNSIDETFEPTPVNPEETIATILCSSGTTGLPKGVMTTHSNMTAYAEIAGRVLGSDLDDGNDVFIGVVPFFHSFGFMLMTLGLLSGKELIVLTKFEPKLFLESIVKYKVTTVVVPPPLIVFLAKHPLTNQYDLSCVKAIRSGAAPLSKETEREIIKKYKIGSITQAYGMTETTLGVLLTTKKVSKLGSAGRLVPGMKSKVIDKNGKTVGANKEGELCFKGPLIMKGYIGNETATADTIDKDGWIHTGDIGYYDSEGYFFIVDRIKELIKYKAYQVAPAELEGILLTHPAVSDVAVVGLADENVGELPLAYVVKKPSSNVTAKQLEDYVAAKVSPQKRLRGGVHFIETIPRNVTGKILRRVLRERAKKLKSKL